jgi:hypothetical protein
VSVALLQPVLWCAAFWIALHAYSRRARPQRPLRFALALALGAALAHAGWLLLHAPAVWPALRSRPSLLLDPSLGFCVLFLPLGPLLLERSASAFASLPLALAVARLGCLTARCCRGTPTLAPWAVAGLHPTALYEIAGLLALQGAAWRAGPRWAAPLVLGGLGALRLLIEPMRAAPPLGAPLVAPGAIAAAWVVLAAALAGHRFLVCLARTDLARTGFDRILIGPPVRLPRIEFGGRTKGESMHRRLAALLLLGAAVAFAADRDPTSASKRQLTLALFELTGGGGSEEQLVGVLLAQLERNQEAMIEQGIAGTSGLPPEAQAELRAQLAGTQGLLAKLRARISERIDFQQLLQGVAIPIYDRRFDERDLREMVAFYRTPAGRKAAAILPQIAQETSRQVAEAVEPQILGLAEEIIAEEAAQLAEADST